MRAARSRAARATAAGAGPCIIGAGFRVARSSVALALLLLFAAYAPAAPGLRSADISPELSVRELSRGVWLVLSWTDYPGAGRISANGLLVEEGGYSLLIDAPWNDAEAEALYRWSADSLKLPIKKVLVEHYHDDCLGGLRALHRLGAESWALGKTIAICRERGLPVPMRAYEGSTVMAESPIRVEAFFPGPGHTVDAAAAWLPGAGILFGGCSVKAAAQGNLGNTADADMGAWAGSLRTMKARVGERARVVVPGHGDVGGVELIDHTIELIKG